MSANFVHLHLHTHYSMLDGACTAPGLISMAKELEMPGIAITDHGYMGGVEEFYRLLTPEKITPIIGFEAYIAPNSREDRDPAHEFVKGFHLVLLAENQAGYHSLCKLMSEAYRTGVYYKPRIDKSLLRQYHEGLIGLSACVAGEIPRRLEAGNWDKANAALDDYLEIFGESNFFIELMDHNLKIEKNVNPLLIKLAKERNIPMVVTNDVHYMKKEDAASHEVMLCIQTGSKLSDPNRFRFETEEFYFKSPEEMSKLFPEIPEALSNTVTICERCAADPVSFDYKANHYPVYYAPDGSVPGRNELRDICLRNMKRRYDFEVTEDFNPTPEQQKILDRMDYELGIIERTGFCSYFMVVSDFIRHAKEQGVPVGPGRGSGAGSVVAYLTLITDIDPLRYDLLFERFLNPERVSPPDFDIDFCERRRGEVIEYVRQKYGFDNVAQICTYGQLKAKAVVKDVARVLDFTFDESNRLTKLIPSDLKMTVAKALEESADLASLAKEDPKVAKLIEYAQVLEGLNRQAGVHAAGVIIGDQRLDNLVPLSRSAQNDMVVQFPKEPCEKLGLLKMDFLGLRTLTIIQYALDLIKEHHGINIDTSKIPLDDQKTFDMLRRGDTVAVFQLESDGMQNLCRSFGVDTIEHIIALVALYRPGPLQFKDDFIKRKKGLVPIEYDHPKMEPYLRETYGIMLYQEQIMQVVQALAGFSLGGADILRRAIGKKKEKEMAQQRIKFIEGCAKTNNISEELAETIWEKINMFAGYGFNKSHSAAYGVVSYHTAWLKANYPVEFMASVMTSELENAEKLSFLINACREMGIKILPPDVNSSAIYFSVDKGRIRFGLGAIKGCGEGAAGKIIASRHNNGHFKSFLDFCERCGTEINSRMLEFLTRAGAFDSLGLRRSQILAIAESMMSYASAKAKDRAAGQGSLFDMLDEEETENCSITIPDIPEFAWMDILNNEKELLGFYVSGHPLDRVSHLIHTFGTPIHKLPELADNTAIRLAGMVSTYVTKNSKNSGKNFGVLQLEDLDGSAECMLYERVLKKLADNPIDLAPGANVIVEATVKRVDENDKPRIIVENIYPLEKAPELFSEEIYLHIFQKDINREQLRELAAKCRNNQGKTKLMPCVVTESGDVVFIESFYKNSLITNELLTDIEKILGAGRYRIKTTECATPKRGNWQPREQETQVVVN